MLKLRNKIMATLAAFALALTGGTLAAGFSAPAHASQRADVSVSLPLYAEPSLALHTNGENNLLDVNTQTFTFIFHHISSEPTGYYTIRTTTGHLIFVNTANNVEEGAVRNPDQPSDTNQIWVLLGSGNRQTLESVASATYMGVWGTNPGPPVNGATVRVRSPQTNWYDGWELFPEIKQGLLTPAAHKLR